MHALTQSNDTPQFPNVSDFAPVDREIETTPFNTGYGPWALVTGASAGIGREFARQLAADGLNLVLASRNRERLEALAEELTLRYGVATRTVPVDLSNTGSVEVLEEATADLVIGRRLFERMGTNIKRTLDRGVNAGEMAGDANTRAQTRFVLATVQGLTVLGKSGRTRKELDDVIDVAMSALK